MPQRLELAPLPKIHPAEDHERDEDEDSSDEENHEWGVVAVVSSPQHKDLITVFSQDSATLRQALKKNKLRKFDVNSTFEDLSELISRADNCYIRAWLWFAFPEYQAAITAKMGYSNLSKYLQALKITALHAMAVSLAFVVQVAFPGLMLQQEYERDCETFYDPLQNTSAFTNIEKIRHEIKVRFKHRISDGDGGFKTVGCEDLCSGHGDFNTRAFAVLLSLYAFGEMFETVRECQVMMRLHANTRASHFARLLIVLGCWAQLVSFAFLLVCTSALFLRSPDYKDLLLNAVALTFVLEIDNKIEAQSRAVLTSVERKLVSQPQLRREECGPACVSRHLLRMLFALLSTPLTLLAECLQSVAVSLIIAALIGLMVIGSSMYIAICI